MEAARDTPVRPEVRGKRRSRRSKRYRSGTSILLPTIRETEVAFTVPAHLLGPDQAQLRTAPADRGSFFSGAARASPETMAYYYVSGLAGSRLKISASVSEDPEPEEAGPADGLPEAATASESEYASASEGLQEPPPAGEPEQADGGEEAPSRVGSDAEDLVAGESRPEGESEPNGKAGLTCFRLHWGRLLKRPAATAGPALPAKRGGESEEVVAVVTLPLSRSSSFTSEASGGSPAAPQHSLAAAAHSALSSMIADGGLGSPPSPAASEASAASAGAATPGSSATSSSQGSGRQRSLQLRLSIESPAPADASASSASERSDDEGAYDSAQERHSSGSLRRECSDDSMPGLIYQRSDSAFREPEMRLPAEPACRPASPVASAPAYTPRRSPLSPSLRAPHGMLNALPAVAAAADVWAEPRQPAAPEQPVAAAPPARRRCQALQGEAGARSIRDSLAAALSQARTPEQLHAEIARRQRKLSKLVAVHGAWCKALQRPGCGGTQESSLEADDSARVSEASSSDEPESVSAGPPSSSGSDPQAAAPVATLRLRGGATYRGQLSARGVPQGLGSYEVLSPHPSGPGGRTDRYQGEFERGRMHGSGVYSFADYGWHSGEWVGGRQQGYGQRVFASGTACLGSFGSGGGLAGHGACFYPSGDSFQGEFRAGVPHGKGQHKAADGAHYAGSFSKGRRAGLGVYRFPTGDTFAGGFRDDAPHGLGIYTLAGGERLEAEFCGGEVHGWGVRALPCGLMAAGKWERGRLLWSRVLRRELGWQEGLADADAEGMDAAQEVARNARHAARLAGHAARAARDEPGAVAAAVRASLAAAERAEAAAARAARLAAA